MKNGDIMNSKRYLMALLMILAASISSISYLNIMNNKQSRTLSQEVKIVKDFVLKIFYK